MKKSIVVMLACALILTLGLAAWAAKPVPDGDTTTKVTGGGWFVSFDSSDHCSLGFQARGLQGGGTSWTGSANFVNRDYGGGLLQVKMTFNNMIVVSSEWIQLKGVGDVYIEGALVATDVNCVLGLVDGAVEAAAWPDRAGIIVTGYFVDAGDLGGGQIKFH